MHYNSLPLLITIDPSHYCEKVRWAMQYSSIYFTEQTHFPLYHFKSTRPAGGRSTPLLITDEKTFLDSTQILKYIDTLPQRTHTWYPENPDTLKEVDEFEAYLDKQLGPHTRRIAYFHLLPHKAQVLKFFSRASARERRSFSLAYPLIRWLMRKSMNITPVSTERSMQKVWDVFTRVETLLADGRSHLFTDKLGAADISFAALAAPVILPHGYIPDLDLTKLPDELQNKVHAFRESVAGQYVLKLFAEFRNAPSGTS